MANMPDSAPNLVDPVAGDPLLLSSGKAQSRYIKDLNDELEATAALLQGPAFTNPKAFAVTADQLIHDCESLTASVPIAGTWTAVNPFAGTVSVSTVHTPFGTSAHSIQAKLCQGPDNNSDLNAKVYVNLASNQSVGTRGFVAVDVLSTQGSGSSRGTWEFFCSDAVDIGGTVTTQKFPEDLADATWTTVYIPVHALASVRCIGVRSLAYGQGSTPSARTWNIDQIRFAAQTELDVALNQHAFSNVFVPASYAPSIPRPILPVQTGQHIVDLRPDNLNISKLAGVTYIRQFGLIDETGTVDVTAELNAIMRLCSPGTVLMGTPGAKYRVEGTLSLLDLQDVTVDFNGATIIRKAAFGAGEIIGVDRCQNVKLRKAKVFQTRHETYLGDTFVVAGTGAAINTGTHVATLSVVDDMASKAAAVTAYARDADGYIQADAVLSASVANVANDAILEFYDLGAPTAPVVAQVGAEGGVPAGTYYYRVSYVDAEYRETGMSLPAKITTTGFSRVQITLPLGPTTGSNGAPIISRRVYRTNANEPSPNLHVNARMLIQINDNTTTTIFDNNYSTHANGTPNVTTFAENGAGNLSIGAYRYWVARVFTSGQEEPFDSIRAFTTTTACKVRISALPGTGDGTVAKRRIYRNKVNSGRADLPQLYLVGETASNAETFFDDNIADTALQVVYHPSGDISTGASPGTPRMGQMRITVATTPTTYSLRWKPIYGGLDMPLGFRVRKLTSTANTITLTSGATYGRGSYNAAPSHSPTMWSAERYVGDTVTGGPTVGTYVTGDYVVDGNGTGFQYVCSVGGSPGTWVRGPFGGERDHGVSINNGCQGIVVEGMHFEGVAGDAVAMPGNDSRDVIVRDCVSRAVRRQGFSATNGREITFERCRSLEPSRSGYDLEPAGVQLLSDVRIIDCEARNVGNYAIAAHYQDRLVIQDFRQSGRQDMQTNGLLFGTGSQFSMQNIHAPYFDASGGSFGGRNVYIDNLTCRTLNLSSGQTYEIPYNDRFTTGSTSIIDNVWLTAQDLLHPFICTLPNTHVGMIHYLYSDPPAFATNAATAPFRVSAVTPAYSTDTRPSVWALLDPGPHRALSSTFKGIMAGNLWFPRGQNLLGEGLLNARGLSSGATRMNNLSQTVGVSAGATTATVTFPMRAYPNIASFTATAITKSLAGLGAGTYYYRIAARPFLGGPVVPLAAVGPVTISGALNAVGLVISGLITGTTWIEGLTVYRGSASGGPYTVRYDIVPNDDLFTLGVGAGGVHTITDNGTTLTVNTDDPNGGWGYADPVSQTSSTGFPAASYAAGAWLMADETGYEADASYTVNLTGSWVGTFAVTAKRRDGYDVALGVACPVGGGSFDAQYMR